MSIKQHANWLKTSVLGRKIDRKVKSELAKTGQEVYIFSFQKIEEWCFFVCQMVEADLGKTINKNVYSKKMRQSFIITLVREAKANSNYHVHYNNKNKMVEITTITKGLMGFQDNIKFSASAQLVSNAKNSALDYLEKKVGKMQKRQARKGALHGHHGGTGSENVDPTTLGALNVYDTANKKANRIFSLKSLIEESHLDQEELLDEVIKRRFVDLFEAELGLNTTVTHNTGGKIIRNAPISMHRIYISFALGTGIKGRQYTAALRDWDAGRAGRLGTQIDRILKDVENEILRFVALNSSYGVDLTKLGGSPSHIDALISALPKVVIEETFGPLTKQNRPDMRFKVNKKIYSDLVQMSKNTNATRKTKATGAILAAKTGKALSKSGKAKKYDRKTPTSDVSLAALMQHINSGLPRHLKRNMEPPALQYRGRGNPSRPFAGPFNTGVKVTAVRPNQKVAGGVDIDYTYEKYPYQTFEPGFLKGSVLRDPRKLIEESIRDVLIERRVTRFLNMRRT